MGAEHHARPRMWVELVERDAAHPCAGATGDVRPEPHHPAVLVFAHQDLVTRPELERPRDRIERRARVRHEREVGRIGAQICGQAQTGRLEPFPETSLASEELDRLALELALPLLIAVEDRSRAGAERAVVQKHDVRVEEEEILHTC